MARLENFRPFPKNWSCFYNHIKMYVVESYKYLSTIINAPPNAIFWFDKADKLNSTTLELLRKLRYHLDNTATKPVLISLIQSAIWDSCLRKLFSEILKGEYAGQVSWKYTRFKRKVELIYEYAIKMVKKCIERNFSKKIIDYFEINVHHHFKRNTDFVT